MKALFEVPYEWNVLYEFYCVKELIYLSYSYGEDTIAVRKIFMRCYIIKVQLFRVHVIG